MTCRQQARLTSASSGQGQAIFSEIFPNIATEKNKNEELRRKLETDKTVNFDVCQAKLKNNKIPLRKKTRI